MLGRTGRAIAEAGLHPASGGDGSQLCSGDMLLEALVACAGVTLRAVATSLGISVDSGRVRAEGDLDFRGTMAVGREAPGRVLRDPSRLRARQRRRRGGARDAAEADRALLRRLPDARLATRAVRGRRRGLTRTDARAAGTRRRARQGARDAALDDARRRAGAGRAGDAAVGAAGRPRDRMARRLRLPDQLRGEDAVRRPLPLAGPAPQPAAAAPDAAGSGARSTASRRRPARSSASSSGTRTSTTPWTPRRSPAASAAGPTARTRWSGSWACTGWPGRRSRSSRTAPTSSARSRSASRRACTRSCCWASPSPTTAR